MQAVIDALKLKSDTPEGERNKVFEKLFERAKTRMDSTSYVSQNFGRCLAVLALVLAGLSIIASVGSGFGIAIALISVAAIVVRFAVFLSRKTDAIIIAESLDKFAKDGSKPGYLTKEGYTGTATKTGFFASTTSKVEEPKPTVNDSPEQGAGAPSAMT